VYDSHYVTDDLGHGHGRMVSFMTGYLVIKIFAIIECLAFVMKFPCPWGPLLICLGKSFGHIQTV
jgi:hypothetical protein